MAGSRLERIGTIYSRATGLLQSKAMAWEDRPLWYDIYEAFPPKEEPRYDRAVPNMPLKKIFYEEDVIRAKFHQKYKIGAVNLLNNKQQSITQHFIEVYRKLEAQYGGKASEDQIYEEAVDMLKKEKQKRLEGAEEPLSLSESFLEAEKKLNVDTAPVNIKISDILKD